MAENRTEPANPPAGRHHVSITATTVAFALSRGLTLGEIEAETGLDAAALGDPAARPSDEIAHRLWTRLASAAGPSDALAIEAARGAPFSALAGMAHGVQFAATLRAALSFIIRNRSFLADRLEISLEDCGAEARLISRHPNDMIDAGYFSHVGVGLATRLVREILCPGRSPLRVAFGHGPHGPLRAYREFFRCPVSFDGPPGTTLVYPLSAMDQPVRTANGMLFEFVERHFELELKRLVTAKAPHDLIRLREAIAAAAAAGDYRAASVAMRLQMSRRSASRLAAAQGSTLQGLIDDARRSAALALLADAAVSISQAAAMTGFSDDRAFRRAFKRWTGQSPAAYRRARRGG